MSHTTPSPATFAQQLAALRKAKENAAQTNAAWLQDRIASAADGKPCYTSMSDGYPRTDEESSVEPEQELLAELDDVDVAEFELEFDDGDFNELPTYGLWLPTAEDLPVGLSDSLRRRLRRFTNIDPVDPLEQADDRSETWGWRVLVA